MSRVDDRPRPVGHKRIAALGAIVLVTLLAGFAVVILQDSVSARRSLEARFAARAELTASFTSEFVDDLAARQQRQAERLLGGPEVDQATFEQVVRAFEFQAAVLLDGSGHLLQVFPARPEILGTDMTADYAHLRAAVGGQVAVSQVVPAAATGEPITAVAVPFETPEGRRVLSGAFSPAGTPLGAYFASVVPVYGGAAFLVDGNGEILADGHGSTVADPALFGLPDGLRHVDLHGESTSVATVDVPGTPWQVVIVGSDAGLFAPADGARWASWVLLGVLGVVGLAAIRLALRLNRARGTAADSARTDALTGLPNRFAVSEVLDELRAAGATRDGHGAVLLLDLDHFKDINDRYGHEAGDQVLQAVGAVLHHQLREEFDIAGRWGGEEFMAVIRRADLAVAEVVAERMRASVAAIDLPDDVFPGRVTASIGVAEVIDGDVDTALRKADDGLYGAKAGGRDRVVAVGAPA